MRVQRGAGAAYPRLPRRPPPPPPLGYLVHRIPLGRGVMTLPLIVPLGLSPPSVPSSPPFSLTDDITLLHDHLDSVGGLPD
jgi:hypothetical protein